MLPPGPAQGWSHPESIQVSPTLPPSAASTIHPALATHLCSKLRVLLLGERQVQTWPGHDSDCEKSGAESEALVENEMTRKWVPQIDLKQFICFHL